MPETALQMGALIDLVIARTGLDYYTDKRDVLERLIVTRMHGAGVATPDAYRAMLDAEPSGAEWRALESLITIRETFFFRDAAQFEALERHILPRLLRERAGLRRLRVWSAGCSNGAEPYSLAILLRRMLDAGAVADAAAWQIEIVGTDLSAFALSEAQKAEFRPWSLRGLTREQIAQWFDHLPARNLWRLRPKYAAMVRFAHGNLLDLTAEGGAEAPFDLILCRNVLIYFTPARMSGVVGALAGRLRPGGWLVLGHAEGGIVLPPALVTQRFPGAQAYHHVAGMARRGMAQEAAVCPPSAAPPLPGALMSAVSSPGASLSGASLSGALLFETPPPLTAGRCGGDGLDRAWGACINALERDPMSPDLHYTHAVLATARGDDRGAIDALRRVIYLDRQHVLAHYRLASLLAEHDDAAARRESGHAASLARARPADEILPGGEGITAGGLLALLASGAGARAGGTT